MSFYRIYSMAFWTMAVKPEFVQPAQRPRGMSADELIKGVKIAGAPKTMALLKLGARLLA
jgi:hypothetical protein